jgi:hydrogenase maturation protease
MALVIGIGNDWRGDDGLGPRVVETVSSRPGLETMTVHQLLPELSESVHAARRVLFVDAALNASGLRLERVEPHPHRGLAHACSPGALLEWTTRLYGRCPEAWLLSIPGTAFEPGTGLSAQAATLIPEALECIDAWLDRSVAVVAMMNEEEA